MTEQQIIIKALQAAFVLTTDTEEADILKEVYQSLSSGRAKIQYFADDRKYFYSIIGRDAWNKQICETRSVSHRFFEGRMSLQDALGAKVYYPNFKEIYFNTKIYLEKIPYYIHEINPDDTVTLRMSVIFPNITFEDLSRLEIKND